MPLSPAQRERVAAEAKRRGVDPEAAIAAAEKAARPRSSPDDSPSADDAPPPAPASDAPARPIADRLLIGFLPFIRVRELRANWLGLDERIADDDLTCGEFQAKYGGNGQPMPVVPIDSPPGGA